MEGSKNKGYLDLGVLIIRILLFSYRVLSLGSPIFANPPEGSSATSTRMVGGQDFGTQGPGLRLPRHSLQCLPLKRRAGGFIYRPLSSSFLGLPYRILNINDSKNNP